MIKIIDRDFNLLGEIDSFSSFQFTRKYYKYGDFELHLPISTDNIDMLVKGNIIFYDKGKRAGIIEHKEISQIDKEEILIKGYTLGSFLNRRITIPPIGTAYDVINAAGETVLKHYIDVNCVNAVDLKRKIDRLIIEQDLGRGYGVNWQSRFKQLDEELEKISQACSLGWNIELDFDNEQFIFKIIEGKDLTANQDVNPPVIFSVDFDNVSTQEFTDTNIGAKNFAYVGGQGEGVDREVISVGDNYSGIDRVEAFIDARDIEQGGDLVGRGQQKLLELQPIMSFTNEILNNTFKYQEDWDLGDIVTCKNKEWGITMDTRITEVKEIYEASGFKLEVVFGNSVPKITEKLKKLLDSPMIENPTETKYDDRYYTKTEVDDLVSEAETSTYIFTQIAASATWNINHNLNKRPSVTIVDSGGNVVIGDIKYIDDNNIKAIFSSAFGGNAYLN